MIGTEVAKPQLHISNIIVIIITYRCGLGPEENERVRLQQQRDELEER